jgi:heterodisulfide reductase subunit B
MLEMMRENKRMFSGADLNLTRCLMCHLQLNNKEHTVGVGKIDET